MMNRVWDIYKKSAGLEPRKEDLIEVGSKAELWKEVHERISEELSVNFSSEEVKDIDGIFSECSVLKKVVLDKWNFPKVQSMNALFERCENLEEVVFKDCKFPEVNSMKFMFLGCKKLKSIKGIDNLQISEKVDVEGMFDGCPVQYEKKGNKFCEIVNESCHDNVDES